MTSSTNFTVLLELVVKDRTQALTSAAKNADTLTESMKKTNDHLSLWTVKRTGDQILRTGQSIIGALTEPIRAAANFQSAMSQVQAVVNDPAFIKGSADFDQYQKSLLDINLTLPQTLEQLAAIGTEAARAGVRGVDNLTRSTREAARASIALGIDGNKLVGYFSAIAAQSGDASQGWESIGNAVFNASTKFARATPEKVFRTMSRLGTVFIKAGIDVEEGATLVSAAFQSSGLEPERLSSVLSKLVGGFSDPETFGALGDALGMGAGQLEEALTDKNGEGVLGIMDMLMPKIKDLSIVGQQRARKALKLSDLELRALTSLAPGWDKVTEAIGKSKDELDAVEAGGKGAIQGLVEIMEKDLNHQLSLLNSAWTNFKVIVGTQYIPLVTKAVEKLTEVMTKLNRVDETTIKHYATIVAAAGAVAVVLGGLISITGGYLLAVMSLRITFEHLRNALKAKYVLGLKDIAVTAAQTIWGWRHNLVLSKNKKVTVEYTNSLGQLVQRQVSAVAPISSTGNAFTAMAKGIRLATWSLKAFMRATLILGLVVAVVSVLEVVFQEFGLNFGNVIKGVGKTIFSIVKFISAIITTIVKIVANVVLVFINIIRGVVNAFVWLWNLLGGDAKYLSFAGLVDITGSDDSGSTLESGGGVPDGLGGLLEQPEKPEPGGNGGSGGTEEEKYGELSNYLAALTQKKEQPINVKTTVNIKEDELKDVHSVTEIETKSGRALRRVSGDGL